MIIEHDTKKMVNANVFGEMLREQFFPEQKSGKHYGCYSTFEVDRGFKRIFDGREYAEIFCAIHGTTPEEYVYEIENDPDTYKSSDDIVATKIYLRNDGCVVGWYWDGDGTLAVSDGHRIAVNNDCKKDYEWNWFHVNETFNETLSKSSGF